MTGAMATYQAVRGLVWVVISLPMVRTLRGQPDQVAFLVGSFYALRRRASLLLPGDQPADLQAARLITLVTTNSLFGWLVGWTLRDEGEGNHPGIFWCLTSQKMYDILPTTLSLSLATTVTKTTAPIFLKTIQTISHPSHGVYPCL